LAKKFALALTSYLFDVLLLLFHGTKSSWTFLEKALWLQGTQVPNWQNLQTTVQRNSLRGCNSPAIIIPHLLKGTIGIQPPKTVQKDYTSKEISTDPDGVNYARLLKVTKAKRF
jgi:hypothetical protein